jgi:lipoate-protein ligase A
MNLLDAIRLDSTAPGELIGLQSGLMKTVAQQRARPTLVCYRMSGRALSIGRYHVYAGPSKSAGVDAYRRLTGGRIAAAGDGWFGFCLIVPYVGALLGQNDRSLRPEQIINRYSRGVLRGLRALGLDCFYPGRDAITINRRQFALCSLETDASGSLLFEVFLAVAHGFEELAADLDRFDPEGRLTCAMYDPDSATTLNREIGHSLSFTEIAETVERGCALEFGEVNRRALGAEESRSAAEMRDRVTLEWPADGRADGGHELAARAAMQLGVVEVRVRLDSEGIVLGLQIAGDFIAGSGAIDCLTRELRGKPFGLDSIRAAVTRSFAGNANFILGVGDLSNLVGLIAKAV